MEYLGLRFRTSFYQHTKTQENSLLKLNTIAYFESVEQSQLLTLLEMRYQAMLGVFDHAIQQCVCPQLPQQAMMHFSQKLIASSARRCCRCVWVWAPFRKRGCKRQTQNSAHMALVVASLFPC